MSGTGKSSALAHLAALGFATIDTDNDAWSQWVTLPDGTRDWIWNEAAMTSLLTTSSATTLFVAGCKTNQGAFYRYFDDIVLLSAPIDVILGRVATRSNNPYGKSFEERREIIEYLETIEPRLRNGATLEIDVSVPLIDVVAQLAQLAVAD
jgi:shikimate kinase